MRSGHLLSSVRRHLLVVALAAIAATTSGVALARPLGSAPAGSTRTESVAAPGVGVAAASALITGYVRLCGGPAPGRCFIETIGICHPSDGCITSDRVVLLDAHGHRLARQRLRHARFRLRVRPGIYKLELLGDGAQVHGRVMQRKSVRARAGHRTTVEFFFAVP